MCSMWNLKNVRPRTPLVIQWTKIHLPMQRTWVWSLVWEDSTCCKVTKPVLRSYWAYTATNEAHTLLLLSLHAATTETRVPRVCAPPREDTAVRSPHTAMKSSPIHSLQQRKPPGSKEDPSTTTRKKLRKFLKGEIWKNYLVIQPCHIFIYWRQRFIRALSWVIQDMRKNQDITSKVFML